MTRGEIYRTETPIRERGDKPGFYLVVSRSFIAENDDVATVVCAPVYNRVLGIDTEVLLGPEQGVPKRSAARCDFLMLMFKSRLTKYVGALDDADVATLDHALAIALDLP